MTIDPINQPKGVFPTSRSKNILKNDAISSSDKVSISETAKKQALLKNYVDIVKNSPDIREDVVQRAKVNLETYFEENGQIKTEVIQRLTDLLSRDLS